MSEKKKKITVIKFAAQVSKVTTLIDGGLRLVLDMPESAVNVATKMMECKQRGALLEIAAVPVIVKEINAKEKSAPAKRTQRYPYNKS